MSTLRSHTTILFADLSSSTRIGESVDPEPLAELLAQVRRLAEEVVTRHGGVINQFYGDGVLAAFGFLNPREDDVLQAITAALELHEAVAKLPPITGVDIPDIKMQLHSGIHADLIFVQEGDSIQGRYKLTGDALNTTARLSDAAKPGEILVSAPTICNLLPFFITAAIPPLKLKGKRKKLNAYKVLGRTHIRTRFEASLQQGLRDFVGRRKELGLLSECFSRVQQDGCRYFELCGDPGIGKTRLSQEFLVRVAREPHDTVILKAYCDSGDRGRPLQPFIQIINSLFRLKADTTKSDSRAHFRDILRLNYPALTGYEDDYLYLLGLSDNKNRKADGAAFSKSKSDNQKADSALLAQRSMTAIIALIAHITQSKDVILSLDDWHLADDLSSKTLLKLMIELDRHPIFIVAATRTPTQEFNSFRGQSLRLNSLNLRESSLLASGLFNDHMEKPFASRLFEQSGGNPLFIEELCQSFTASQPAQGDSDYINSVPVTLSGLIGARMSRLPEGLHQLVKIAAVLGNQFDQWLYESIVTTVTTPLTNECLLELSEYDVIYQGSSQGTLRFKHGITREVVYDKTGFYERRNIHSNAANILEKNLQQRGSEKYYELLAYHCEGAADQLKTGLYAELAGDRAMLTMAVDRAGSQFKRALKALDPDNCPDSSYERWKAILLKFGWVSVFDPLQEHLAAFQRGLILAQRHDDYRAMAKIHYWLAYLCYALGDSVNAIQHCEQAFELAGNLSAWSLQVETTALLGQAKGAASNYDEAIVLLDNAMNAKLQHKKHERLSVGSAYSLACKGAILGDQGQFDQAYECFETALESLQGEDYFHVEGSVLGLYAVTNLWQGRWSQAKQIADKAHQAAQRISRSYMSSIYLSISAYADWKMTGNETATRVILAQTGILEKHQKLLFLSLNYGWLSEMLVATEKWQLARKYAARALVRARHHDRLGEAMAYRALSMISECNSPDSNQKYLDRARTSASERHARHETAKNNLFLASMFYRTKRYQSAHDHLDLALQDFKAMNMSWYEQQALNLLQLNAASA
ncbi:MAG: AAA family ATPase [Ketobacter sp.]